MNCPSHCVIFGSQQAQLPRAAVARGRLRRACIATSAAASCTASRACAASARTTRTSSAPRAESPREIERFIKLFYEVVQGVRLRGRSTSSSRRARPDKRIGTDADWDTSEERARRGSRSRADLPFEIVAGRGRVLRTEGRVPRARTRSSARGSSARSSSTRTCPSASSSRTPARTARTTARSCSTAPSSGRSSASSACTSSTAAETSRRGSRRKQAIVLTVSEKSDAYAQRGVRAH